MASPEIRARLPTSPLQPTFPRHERAGAYPGEIVLTCGSASAKFADDPVFTPPAHADGMLASLLSYAVQSGCGDAGPTQAICVMAPGKPVPTSAAPGNVTGSVLSNSPTPPRNVPKGSGYKPTRDWCP